MVRGWLLISHQVGLIKAGYLVGQMDYSIHFQGKIFWFDCDQTSVIFRFHASIDTLAIVSVISFLTATCCVEKAMVKGYFDPVDNDDYYS